MDLSYIDPQASVLNYCYSNKSNHQSWVNEPHLNQALATRLIQGVRHRAQDRKKESR